MPFDPRAMFLMGQEAQGMGMASPYSSAPISGQELSFLNPKPEASGSKVLPRDMFMGLAQIMPLLDSPRPQMGGMPGSPHVGNAALAPALFGATLPGPQSQQQRVPSLGSFLR